MNLFRNIEEVKAIGQIPINSLINADCFEVLPYVADKSVDLVLCDLPYGITALGWDSTLPLDKLWVEYKRVLKRRGVVILTSAQPFTWKVCASNPSWFKDEIIWEKPNGTNPLQTAFRPFRVHENILVFYDEQPTYNPQMTYGHPQYSGFEDLTKYIGEVYNGDDPGKEKKLISKHRKNTDGSRFPRSIQRFAQDRGGEHPTKKPVDLMAWLVRSYTNPGDLVLDNTMGAGTTCVASLKEGRAFIGIELDTIYYERAVLAVKRELLNWRVKCPSEG